METMLQYFEWDFPADGTLWRRLYADAGYLKDLGITMVWMPPAYKGQGGVNDTGYGVYDMYDLGEFDAKGTVRTKYGTKEEYVQAVKALGKQGIDALADIVFNHRMGADYPEEVKARTMDWSHRNTAVAPEHPVEVWTGYDFPDRHNKYSRFHWTWKDFTGTDFDQTAGKTELMEFDGKKWDSRVSKEEDNFDFIMGDDVDFQSRRVIRELYRWGRWYLSQVPVNGFRLDAVKSIDSGFFTRWLRAMRKELRQPAFAVGEWWSGDVHPLLEYLEASQRCMALFDVPLHYHLQQASQSNGTFDLRQLFRDTLAQRAPALAVPFVDNHDTQPGQALESWVMDWFRPQTNAILLLRDLLYPCVFFGDLYGMTSGKPKTTGLEDMLRIRSRLSEGVIRDYETGDGQVLVWKNEGAHPFFVILTEAAGKECQVREPDVAGCGFTDIMDRSRHLQADETGNMTLSCPDGGLSVWVRDQDLPLLDPADAAQSGG